MLEQGPEELTQILDYHYPSPKPDVVNTLDDLKTPNNIILLSNILANHNFTEEELKSLFQSPEQLNEYLEEAANVKKPHTPPLPMYVLPTDQKHLIIQAIGFFNKKQLHVDDEQALLAEEQPKIYIYPSGKIEHYQLLINEIPKNCSVLFGAFAEGTNKNKYIRSNHLRMIRALDGVQETGYEISGFSDYVVAMPLMHEATELDIVNNLEQSGNASAIKKIHKHRFEFELEVERQTRKALHKEGIPDDAYKHYHSLRASPHYKNVSQIIKEKEF